MTWLHEINPGFVMIVVGVLAFLPPRGVLRAGLIAAAPLLGFGLLLIGRYGDYGRTALFGLELVTFKLDQTNFGFAAGAFLAQFLASLFAFDRTSEGEDAAALVQAGAIVAAMLAGDLASFAAMLGLWTIAFAAAPLARRTAEGISAALRSLVLLSIAWVALLSGLSLALTDPVHGLAFAPISLAGAPGILIFAALLIAVGAPLLNFWLVDSLASAGRYGLVALAPLAGKLGFYALVRLFPGEEALLVIGAAGAILGAVAAAAERDLNRAIGHSIAGALGVMLMGVGFGAPFGVAGATIFATAHSLSLVALLAAWAAARDFARNGGSRRRPNRPWLLTGASLIAAFSLVGAPGLAGFPGMAMLHAAADGAPLWALAALVIYVAGTAHVFVLRLTPAIWASAEPKPEPARGEEAIASSPAASSPAASSPAAPSPARRLKVAQFGALALAVFACLYSGLAPGWLFALTPATDVFDPYLGAYPWIEVQVIGGGLAAAFALGGLVLPERRRAQRLAGPADYLAGPVARAAHALLGQWRRLAMRYVEPDDSAAAPEAEAPSRRGAVLARYGLMAGPLLAAGIAAIAIALRF